MKVELQNLTKIFPSRNKKSNEEVVAVITAAIAAMWEGQQSGFVVRRVRRAQNASARARAARDEQIFSRL